MKLKTPFKSSIPGKDWLSSFLKCHSIMLRCQTALLTVCGPMLNETVIQKYFNDIQGVIESLNLQNSPEQIWNMDESLLSLTHKPTKVYVEESVRNIPGRVGNNRESITMNACVNAAGNDIPPMIIVKGKTRKSLYMYKLKRGQIYLPEERMDGKLTWKRMVLMVSFLSIVAQKGPSYLSWIHTALMKPWI